MAAAASPSPPRQRFPWVNVGFFLATVVTTLFAGTVAGGEPDLEGLLSRGVPFSAAMLGILLSHELGHYLMGRAYGVSSTLPFFVPGPPPVGTFGAVIRIRSLMPSRRAVLDIGAAGPIAGFIVAVPLLLWGLAHSQVQPFPHPTYANTGSLLEVVLARWRHEELVWPGSGTLIFGDSLVSWAAQRLAQSPLPPGYDIVAGPVAQAAIFGLLVTALNLFPIGQLDGGHVLYAWLGRERARAVSRGVSWSLLVLGLLVSWNWLVWWLVTRLVGLGHPPALSEEPLDRPRRVVAAVSLLIFAATFAPVPIRELL